MIGRLPRTVGRGRARRRRIALLALVLGLVLALVGPAAIASAHAQLIGSNPTDGTVVATAPTREWLQAFEKSPKVQRVFALLAEHGSISEVEVAAILGPREFRQFSLKFKEHAAKAPFEIRVEPINNVKTYVREGTAQ